MPGPAHRSRRAIGSIPGLFGCRSYVLMLRTLRVPRVETRDSQNEASLTRTKRPCSAMGQYAVTLFCYVGWVRLIDDLSRPVDEPVDAIATAAVDVVADEEFDPVGNLDLSPVFALCVWRSSLFADRPSSAVEGRPSSIQRRVDVCQGVISGRRLLVDVLRR